MKLIFVIQGMQSGGAERVMSVLCNTYVRQGHSVILTLTENVGQSAYELDSRIKLVNMTDHSTVRPVFLKRIRSVFRLKRLFQKEKPDAVVSFITRTNICAIAAGVLSGTPVFISERNDPAVDPKSKSTRWLRNLLYPLSAGCIFQTEYAKNCFKDNVRNKGIVIFNPVTDGIYDVTPKTERKKRIVSLCRLNSQKNIPMLIRAFEKADKRRSGYWLEIYGEGEEKTELLRLIKELKLDNKVFLKGHTSKPLQILAESEIFALSSDYEGMPNSLIEALCMGCACIATDAPAYGARELVLDAENGLLVPVGDENAFADALYSLRESMSRNAARAEALINTSFITSQWMDFIVNR